MFALDKNHKMYNYVYYCPILFAIGIVYFIIIPYNKLLISVGILYLIFIIFFFRNLNINKSKYNTNLNGMVTPSSGNVIGIFDNENNNGYMIQTHVNLWDCHYFVSPCDGVITNIEERNVVDTDAERVIITILPKNHNHSHHNRVGLISSDVIRIEPIVCKFGNRAWLPKWFFKRIMVNCKVGDEVKRGEKLGMIRFGSRMETSFPKSYKLNVNAGDNLTVGESFLAFSN